MSGLTSLVSGGFRSPGWVLLRIAFVAALAWLLYHGLAHFGYGWAMIPVALFAVTLWAAESWRLRNRRHERMAAWDRWEAAVLDDDRRPVAIQEAREALRRALRLGSRLKVEQAHLSVILAELLDASDRAEEACEVLARVKLDDLDEARRAVVRHAKAVVQISAGRFDEAEATLRSHRPSSEPDVDARIELLSRMVRIEKGEAAAAMQGLDSVLAKVPDDETGLADDVLVVRAACMGALGRRDDALTELKKLDAPVLANLARLGAPRVRALAKAAMGDTKAEAGGA
jgi:tetratricopeptide (TPR) repeat protein